MSFMNKLFGSKPRTQPDNDKQPKILTSEKEPIEVCPKCGKPSCSSHSQDPTL